MGKSTGTEETIRAQAAADIGARLDRLPATRTIWTIVGLLSLAFFFELYDMLLSGYIAPGLVASGILTTTTPGLFGTSGIAAFVAALFAGLAVGTMSAGVFIDRFGRRAVFTFALLGYSAASGVMAFQETAAGLNGWRFAAGLGLGIEMVTINTYISELAPKHLRGRAFAFSQMCGFSAVPVVAFLAFLFVPHAPLGLDGWRWVVLIGCLSALAAWYIRLRLPESPRWLAERGRLAEADAIVSALERRVEAEWGRPLPPPIPAQIVVEEGRFIDIWKPPYRRRAIMMLVFNIFQTVGFYGFATWVPVMLVQQGVTVTKSLAYVTVIALAAPVGPLVGALIGDRVERKHIIVGCAATAAACGMVFANTREPALLILMGMCFTVAQNSLSFAYHAYQTELFPTRLRAKAVGFVYSWSRISTIFNAFIIAFILQRGGVPGVFAFIGAAMVVVMIAIGVFGPRTARRSLEEISP